MCVKTIFPRSVASVCHVINDPIIEMNRLIKVYFECDSGNELKFLFMNEMLFFELYGCNCNRYNLWIVYFDNINEKYNVYSCYKINYV